MTTVNDLYQQVILDHNQHPRNFGAMPDAQVHLEGYNPLCGDRYTVYLSMDGERIGSVGFSGHGCAISKASASMMTALVKGMTREEAEELSDQFRRMVTGDGSVDVEELGKLAVFSGVSEFPARVKCATLAWHTLQAVLEGQHEMVSTEEGDA